MKKDFTWRQVLGLIGAAYLQVLGLDTVRALVLGKDFTGSVMEPFQEVRALAWPAAAVFFGVGTVVAALLLSRRDGSSPVSKVPMALVGGGLLFLVAAAMSGTSSIGARSGRPGNRVEAQPPAPSPAQSSAQSPAQSLAPSPAPSPAPESADLDQGV